MSDFKYLKECDCGCENVKSDHVTYYGPNLPCSDVDNGDNLSTIIKKIDNKICELTPVCSFWEASIRQEGTNPPIITVINTNFPEGYNVQPIYAGTGKYFLEFSGLANEFIEEATLILTGTPQYNYTKFYVQVVPTTTALYLETRDILGNTTIDDILDNTSIYIKTCVS